MTHLHDHYRSFLMCPGNRDLTPNKGIDTRAIQVYMGHKNIQHTTVYTELAPHRFKYFWSD